jgi:hypothetical protein
MNQLKKNDLGPALLLMLLAPLLTEVLPGATRFSSIFVLPIEICVWGGGALLIRYAVRKWRLGWPGMLFLAFALVIAEEFLIQQTSIAPMVIRLKGETYARAFGVNYVYFIWALIYESTFVVFAPIFLVELIFPSRRDRLWISKGGFFAVVPLFILGSVLAWFSWTQIARPKVFHVAAFTPPHITIAIAILLMGVLIYTALTRTRPQLTNHPESTLPSSTLPESPHSNAIHPNAIHSNAIHAASVRPWAPWVLCLAGAVWASLLFGIVLLGFGLQPSFPPLLAIAGGFGLLSVALWMVPRWTKSSLWQQPHSFFLIFGVTTGAMLIGFLGFMETTGPDLYFKIITNIVALILFALLGLKVNKENKKTYHVIQHPR